MQLIRWRREAHLVRRDACSIAQALDVVGEWWTLLILRDAFLGVTRFDDWQRRLGIARNVLSARLEVLVEQGILERRRYQEHPPRDEYVLTRKGSDLARCSRRSGCGAIVTRRLTGRRCCWSTTIAAR